MSNFSFRPSARESIHVVGGFAGGTGSGKTFTALRVATGLAGGKKFCVIDTEARRALHYAGTFQFDHGDLKPPFTPDAYLEAILAAEAAGYPVAVVDSMSHEHAGEGGLLDWHDAELARMAGDDYQKRERLNVPAWSKPKSAHKRMVNRLLQLRMHLILCFRAEEKIKARKGSDGKVKWVPMGWQPVCATGLEYELTYSFMLQHEHPGIYKPKVEDSEYGHAIKLPEDLRACFPEGKLIDESCGKRLGEWAAEGKPQTAGATTGSSSTATAPDAASSALGLVPDEEHEVQLIDDQEGANIGAVLQELSPSYHPLFYKWLEAVTGAKCIEQIPKKDYQRVIDKLVQRRAAG